MAFEKDVSLAQVVAGGRHEARRDARDALVLSPVRLAIRELLIAIDGHRIRVVVVVELVVRDDFYGIGCDA